MVQWCVGGAHGINNSAGGDGRDEDEESGWESLINDIVLIGMDRVCFRDK
jgi:hypothetical protein